MDSLNFALIFSQISAFDFLVFAILLLVNLVLLLIAMLLPVTFRILLCFVVGLLFLALPFLNAYIIETRVNRVDLSIKTAQKLAYSDTFFIAGTLKNNGKRDLKGCDLYLYVSRFYPLQKAEFAVELEPLKHGESLEFERVISDFKLEDKYKKIAVRCF